MTGRASAAALSACGGGHANADPVPGHIAAAAVDIFQDSVCEVRSWRVADSCTPGGKIVFLPESFGNEQLPVLFAALNCDLHYQVVSTKGAVTCIFLPVKPAPVKAAAPTSPSTSAVSR